MNWFSKMRSPAEPASAPLPDNALVIDVRSPGEYESGHVRGALNLPLDRFAQDIGRLAPDKSVPVMLYCLSGGRSGGACRLMQQLGYQQVINGGSAGAVALQLNRPIERA
ncbi:rhodanese-like domain-containing protein [soil metagenome]